VIKGPNITMRLIRNDEDEHLFQCLKDWPPDAYGEFTRDRASRTISAAMMEHQYIEYPLQDETWVDDEDRFHGTRSDWFATLVIELHGLPIGAAHCRIIGTSVWVEWLALLPEYIAHGHFREIRLAWSWLTFVILQGDRLGFATRTDNAPTMAIMEMYDGVRSKRVRNRGINTDSEKEKFWHSREDYLRNRDAAFKDRDGNPIAFEATA
jgi:hypothetical protein